MLAVFLAVGVVVFAQGNQAESADLSAFTGGGGMPIAVNANTGQLSASVPLLVIPGLDGEGYQMSLNYAPPTPGAEASWVGYGWSLSPGAIQRNQNGIADDFHGTVINISKKPEYTRMTGRFVTGAEALSAINGSIGTGAVWDSDRGILPSVSMSLSGFGAGIRYMQEGGEGIFSASVNPLQAVMSINSAVRGSGDGYGADQSAAAADAGVRRAPAASDVASGTRAIVQGRMQSLVRHFNNAGISGFGLKTRGMLSMRSYENGISGTTGAFVGTIQGSLAADIGGEVGFDTHWTRLRYAPVEAEKEVTGYLRGGERQTGMDFTMERADVVDEYDKFVAAPVAMPDQFSVSAQGLAGSFRGHFHRPGTFHDDPVDYDVEQGVNLGLEFAAGAGNLTAGGTLTEELVNAMDQQEWRFPSSPGFGDEGQEVFFAFDGEPGLHRAYGTADEVPHGKKATGSSAMFNPNGVDLAFEGSTEASTSGQRQVLSKWIRWNAVSEANQHHTHAMKTVHPMRFCNQNLSGPVAAFRSVMDGDHIGEFQVVNASGAVYTFGIPVLERDRVELSFAVPGGVDPLALGPLDYKAVATEAPQIGDFLSGFQTIEAVIRESPSKVITGRIIRQPVASSYLLTSITSPDYVDLTLDGPTEDDLGTWVLFDYEKDFGAGVGSADGEWFQFRNPYWANHFTEGNAADGRDDVASFTAGEKEVFRLSRVETRTHFAEFHASTRTFDGADVEELDLSSQGVERGSAATQKLDSISLYAKGSVGGDLLRVVRLEYAPKSQSLVSGIQGPGTAALTLLGVTIQSTDVREEENMAHFGFGYQYPSAESVLPEGLMPRYGHLFGEHSVFAASAQNPPFSFNASDAWGNPKLTASSPFDVKHPWLDLRAWNVGSTNRDPAAHCLKEVATPGGLSIYPQYEVGDYRFVQDDPACIMVPLKSTSTNGTYVLDFDAVDAEGTGMDAPAVAAYLDGYFDGRMAHYKVKYSLGSTDISKHFTGFTKVSSVTTNGAGDVELNLVSGRKYTTPYDACIDYCGKFTNVSYGLVQDAPSLDEAGVQDFFGRVSEVEGLLNVVPCAQFDRADSYVRIPLLPGMEKHGGPLRVKRVLMLDEGAGAEGALLTGTVYDYTQRSVQTGERLSSGVAAHEPRALYDEFGRFQPLAKRRQSYLDKITQGRDAESQSGPVGDAFLPGPVVLYGEVVTHQIHEGESTLGHAIQQYHTHRDHPTKISWSDEDATRLRRIDEDAPFGPVTASVQELWYAQGMQVEHSPLPGQPRSIRSFGGHFDDVSSWYEVSSTEFDYYAPDEPLPFLRHWTAFTSEQPRFDELYFRGRQIRTEQVRGSVELDLTLQFTPIPIPIPSGWGTYSAIRQVQATHGTTRTISRPLFTKSITTRETGKVTRVEHLAFDPMTFQPVALGTSDGYTGLSFEHNGILGEDPEWTARRIAYSMPAHVQYPELGGMYINDRKRLVSGEGEFAGMRILKFQSSLFGHFLLICKPPESCGSMGFCQPQNVMDNFCPGDLIRVSRKQQPDTLFENHYHVDRVSGNWVFLHASERLGTQPWRSSLDDEYGDVNVEILTSGRKNQLGLSSGGLAVYSEALDVQESERLAGELDALISAMNGARPSDFPDWSATYGSATNLSGLALIEGDKVAFREFGCTPGDCELAHFRVAYRPECEIGYVHFPMGEGPSGHDHLYNAQVDNPTQWWPPVGGCDSVPTSIPIRYNSLEEGGGRFEFDHELGAIVWRTCDNPCNPVVIFTPCRDWSKKIEVDDVISASQTVFRDDLDFEFLPTGGNPYETGARGRWVSHSSWVAQSDASSLDDADVYHSRQSGILDRYEALNEDFADYMVMPHVDSDVHPWIRTSRSTLFDRRGHTLETLDALGHYTSMEMGAQEKLVTWTAQGARNGACLFESFERREGGLVGTLSDSKLQVPALMWSDERGHTGRRSLKLSGSPGQKTRLGQVELDARSLESDGGVEVRFWVHNPKDAATGLRNFDLDSLFTLQLQEVTDSPDDGTTPVTGGLTLAGAVFEAPVDSLVQTGAWTLMEARLPGSQLAGTPLDTRMLITLHWEGTGGHVYLDDLRVRPFNTSMSCAVHDGDDFKVLAELDDDHFARKYQYNRLNQQVRTQVETAGGWKTISESIQHTKPEGP